MIFLNYSYDFKGSLLWAHPEKFSKNIRSGGYTKGEGAKFRFLCKIVIVPTIPEGERCRDMGFPGATLWWRCNSMPTKGRQSKGYSCVKKNARILNTGQLKPFIWHFLRRRGEGQGVNPIDWQN